MISEAKQDTSNNFHSCHSSFLTKHTHTHTHTLRRKIESVMQVPNSAASSGEMDAAGTVIGVLIALGFVIFISALVAAYVLWKDGCCKKRQEEERNGDAEGREREREREREDRCGNDATFLKPDC